MKFFPLDPFEVLDLLFVQGVDRCCLGSVVLANYRLSASRCLRKCCPGASVWADDTLLFSEVLSRCGQMTSGPSLCQAKEVILFLIFGCVGCPFLCEGFL